MDKSPIVGRKYKVITLKNEPTGTKRGDIIKITEICDTEDYYNGKLLNGFNITTNKKLSSGIWESQIEETKMKLMDLEIK